jgi:hypothetical protein
VSGLFASVLWLQSALVTVRSNLGKFMDVVALFSRWNRRAPQMSSVSALFAANANVWDRVSLTGLG